mmetsp:Transcript_3620/g.14779  ORF Transcript_3620/g.14779 Transcript_3620/m.14779 type:complete len:200 (+) Transcript_3620:74-673(+)
MGLCAEMCGGWTYRKTLWWSWIWNALIACLFSGCGIVVAQKLNKLEWVTNAATGEVDETSDKLTGGLVANIAWGIILNALFLIFSLVVLLRKTIAKTGAGFSYGVIVGSAIHMFFAQCEVAIALDSHDKWLKQSLAESTDWASQDNNTYRGMYVLGFVSSVSYLIFAVVMIVCMKAVMKESSESYTEFRDRYGVSSQGP